MIIHLFQIPQFADSSQHDCDESECGRSSVNFQTSHFPDKRVPRGPTHCILGSTGESKQNSTVTYTTVQYSIQIESEN